MVIQQERPETKAPPRLTRSSTDKVVAGVCGGLGRYFGVDPVWFRVAFVALALGGGAGVLLYVIAWIALPADQGNPVGEGAVSRPARAAAPIAGLVLMAVGSLLLLDRFTPWAGDLIGPALVVAVGLVLLLGGRHD